MNLEEKLEEVVEQHNNVLEQIGKLQEARQQLLGQAQLLEEQLKEQAAEQADSSEEADDASD